MSGSGFRRRPRSLSLRQRLARLGDFDLAFVQLEVQEFGEWLLLGLARCGRPVVGVLVLSANYLGQCWVNAWSRLGCFVPLVRLNGFQDFLLADCSLLEGSVLGFGFESLRFACPARGAPARLMAHRGLAVSCVTIIRVSCVTIIRESAARMLKQQSSLRFGRQIKRRSVVDSGDMTRLSGVSVDRPRAFFEAKRWHSH